MSYKKCVATCLSKNKTIYIFVQLEYNIIMDAVVKHYVNITRNDISRIVKCRQQHSLI